MPDKKPFQWVAEWHPRRGRDPVAVLDRAAEGRDPARVAERKAEMTADSLAAFFRGAAGVMADDLGAERHTTQLVVDVNGDAHLENFGMYNSPERVRVFDLNDFDEARPGPWEWDVARLVASAAIIERDHGAGGAAERESARNVAQAYAATAEKLAGGNLINRWYRMTRCDGIKPADLGLDAQSAGAAPSIERAEAMLKEQEDRSQQATVEALTKDGEFLEVDGVAPLSGAEADRVRGAFDSFRGTIMPGLQRLVDGYTPTAVASRPSGMGSLGLRNYLLLICGTAPDDALILQVKEATPSQLDEALGPMIALPEGRRVVELQRVMQGASDPLLGWVTISKQDFYVRQFRDMKATPKITKDKLTRDDRLTYARLCGTALARAHARTQQRTGIGQVSESIERDRERFVESFESFARAYADVSATDQALYRDEA